MKYLVVCLTTLMSVGVYAQNILNAKSPQELREMRSEMYDIVNGGQDTISTAPIPLPYGNIQDKDILWSRVVWEIIDLNEKLNQPYYYSHDEVTANYVSLYDALFNGINAGEITEVYDDDNFTSKVDPENLKSKIQAVRESDWLQDKRASGETITEQDIMEGTDHFKVDTKSVKLIKIKGMWYIDKRLGQMKYRLLGIAPMGPDPQVLGLNDAAALGYEGEDEMIDLFWVFYPGARDVLSRYTVFNPRNGSSSITYDDVLNARRFSSIIYKSQSEYGDGEISHYIPGDAKSQLEESNRIKNEILQKENNMWNY
ncbi:gliding motility protein GldN [Apibacter muscae]|uniref:Gliding motility protein GldN n=1 Tax=Apibacter muscae TaxID=2509004 RepID=A0A563DBH3_9FLAO|nr:gliding motility protein GldN [Apibacter muscae]TWP23551.1 gliding motility protein GldN [Apibacter muscae]TWP27462.1 gliding motility protein GldN [Apibacter muscae]TWP28876.1 gliding motility protein GldN [Apibacter muscae]